MAETGTIRWAHIGGGTLIGAAEQARHEGGREHGGRALESQQFIRTIHSQPAAGFRAGETARVGLEVAQDVVDLQAVPRSLFAPLGELDGHAVFLRSGQFARTVRTAHGAPLTT